MIDWIKLTYFKRLKLKNKKKPIVFLIYMYLLY